MTIATDFQEILDEVLFAELGSQIARIPFSSEVIDKWGDATVTTASSSLITAIPYNFIFKNEDYLPIGDIQEGDMVFVIPFDQAVDHRDKFVVNSENYIVKQIEEFPLSDVNLVTFLILAKDLT